MGTELLQYPR